MSIEAFKQAHANSDVDQSRDSQHHTLGEGPNQAASGASVKKLREDVNQFSGTRPVGEITMFGGSAIPVGWLKCDGATFSSNDYPELAALLGDEFGVHSGTTYHLPNLTNRFPVGTGTADLGDTGGVSSHSHTLSDSGQAQVYSTGASVGVRRVPTSSFVNNFVTNGTAGTSGGNSSVGAALRGNTDSNTNLPPFLAINFIIRAVNI